MEKTFPCFASAAFGLEGLVANELRRLGLKDVSAENGGVRFSGTVMDIFRCNLMLHFCDRVFVLLADEICTSFDQLFTMVHNIPWENYLAGDEAINISCKCARSKLMSPRDCQSVSKKAVINRLSERKGIRLFPESGAPFSVLIQIHQNRTRILLNMSGDALSRRGYRTWNGEAPLRETLAAALVELSPWKGTEPLYDPCCGTGTILAEAALMAAHIGPGTKRHFAMEKYAFSPTDQELSDCRAQCAGDFDCHTLPAIMGSDIDENALILASRHMQQAGISHAVSMQRIPLQEVVLQEPRGVFICNPPYGERLSDQASARKLYHDLHMLLLRHPGWSLCAISSDPAFERYFGRRADKMRRLYNGRLECNYFIYFSSSGKA